MSKKVTRAEIIKVLGMDDSDPGKLTLSKGKFTFRREFFYRMSKTAEQVFVKTIEALIAAGYVLTDIRYDEKWAPFRGGEGVRKNSYWAMEAKIEKGEAIEAAVARQAKADAETVPMWHPTDAEQSALAQFPQ